MKHILFPLFFCLFAVAATAQRIDFKQPISYSKVNPTKVPTAAQSAFWYNTTTGKLYRYDKAGAEWVDYSGGDYAEMGISNDTLSISFAATTADTLEGMTAGSTSGFTLNSDGGILTYNGASVKRFLLNYNTSFTFAENANIVRSYIVQNGSAVLKTRARQTVTTAGDNVNTSGNCILTLSPGDTVGLFFVPSAHTGTDALTVYEVNVSLVEID